MHKWVLLAVTGALLLGPAALAADEHGAQRPNIFNADIGNFIFTLIIFGLVILTLGRFAWKPLLNVLNEREKMIRSSLESAQTEREQAERLLAEYKVQLEQAREEASAIVAEGRRDAEATARRIQEQARRETDEVAARARREIQLAADTARKELHDDAAQLAVLVAGRILSKELSAADHRTLVAESLKEMERSDQTKMN